MNRSFLDSKGEGADSQLSLVFDTLENLAQLVRPAQLNLDDAQVLIWMREHGVMTASMVAHKFVISRPKATRIMRRLAETGLIREFIDASDVRKCNYRITNRGTNVVYELGKKIGPTSLTKQLEAFLALRNAKYAIGESGYRLSDTEQRIVLVLENAGSLLVERQICEMAHLKQSKASMAIRTLKEKELLEGVSCEWDGRLRASALTPQGHAVAVKMLEVTSQFN